MRGMRLTTEERGELIALEKKIPHKGIGIRIRIILALDDGYQARDVARILLIDEDTVTQWKRKFLEGKLLSDWLGNDYQGYGGKLIKEQEVEVMKYVEDQVITDCQALVDYIKSIYGIKYSIDGVTKLLHRLGFVYKQTVIMPAKLDVEKQKEFIKQYEELKEEVKAGDHILFGDGVHPTHNTQTVRCWVKKGTDKLVKTNTGRERLNISGALDVESMNVVVGYYEKLNAITTMEFFDTVQIQYKEGTIYMIVDNARYYKNKEVRAYLNKSDCRVKLIFLPSYSPNLNFIERLWKFMRQRIIGVKYREKFKEFEFDIMQFFKNIKDYEEELRPFIGTQFHLITN